MYAPKASPNSELDLGAASSKIRNCGGHGSSRGFGCLPAGGACPEGGRGSGGPSKRDPQGPGTPGLVSGKPVLGSSRSWMRGAAGDASRIQRIPMAVSAIPAATTYLRAFVVVGKEPGRPRSFTVARRSTRGVRHGWTRSAGSTSVNTDVVSDIHGLVVVVFENFGIRVRKQPSCGFLGVPVDEQSTALIGLPADKPAGKSGVRRHFEAQPGPDILAC